MKSDIHAGGTDALQGPEQVSGRGPLVGIYFVVRGEVLIDAVELEKAEPYGDALQHGGHYEWHEALIPKTRAEWQLKRAQYEFWARGRVVYFVSRDVFRIYISPRISKGIIEEIIYLFGLREETYEVEYDEHYN